MAIIVSQTNLFCVVNNGDDRKKDAPIYEVAKEQHPVKADEEIKYDFDAQAVLDYVAQLNTGNKEEDEKCAEFWQKLVGRCKELTHVSYSKEETCFKAGRNEKSKDFSKKFVCCVIGYVKNVTTAYSASISTLCEMLNETCESDSARGKDMQHCLKWYDKSVERVVKEVAKEVFG